MTKSVRDCARRLNDQDLLSMEKEAEAALIDADSIDIPVVPITPQTRGRHDMAPRSAPVSACRQSIDSKPQSISRPTRLQIPSIAKTSGPWKTPEVESHLRYVSKAFQNEDFDEAIAELNVAIRVAPGAPWPLRDRLPLLESRKGADLYIDAIYRKQHRMLCECHDCQLAGRSLYRSAVCQNLGVTPLSEGGVRNVDDLRSAFAYRWAGDSDRDPLSKIWQKFKDDPNEGIWAPTFAVLMMEYLAECSPDYCNRVDVIVCVPPDPVRLEERGADPVENVGDILSKLICVPVVKGLLKKEARNSLRNMGSRERANTARDMFTFVGDQKLHDLTVLLVDDVVTTGSTMQNCARLLKNQGEAAKVKGLSLFRAESSRKAAQIEEALDEADCECWD